MNSRWLPFGQLILARLREFYREPEALFWVYGFPVLLAVGLGVAFASRKPEPPEVDVAIDEPTLAEEVARTLREADMKVELHDHATCDWRLNTGRSMLYVVPGPANTSQFVYDEARAEAVSARYEVEAILRRHQSPDALKASTELRSEPGTRYIDFLLPGLIGLNLMGGGLWGVGFVLVDMRVRKLLKRLLATPMRRGDFLLSILTSRVLLLIPDMALLLALGLVAFGVPQRGNPLVLVLVIAVGSAAFAGIGLVVASRTDKTETVTGLMNLVMLPQWLLSGTFFRSSRFPDAVQPLIQALPLTQLNDALRAVMLDGASLADIAWRLGVLALWAVVSFALALRWFRWQ